MSAKRELIALAAEIVRGTGLPSVYVEDHHLPKTTPITAVRILTKELDKTDRTTKDWAYRLRQIANSIPEEPK